MCCGTKSGAGAHISVWAHHVRFTTPHKSRTAEKSEDELKKYTLDPDLCPFDRILRLLQGNDIQKSVACSTLEQLVTPDQTESEIIQIIMALSQAQVQSGENRQVVLDMSLGIAQLLPKLKNVTKTMKDHFMSLIFAGIDSTRGQYWGTVLSMLLERLTYIGGFEIVCP